MQFLAVTNHGLSELLKLELKVKFGIEANIESESKVLFESTFEEAIQILMFSQGLYRVCALISKAQIEDTTVQAKKKIMNWISSQDLTKFMTQDQKFAVRGHRSGDHAFKSVDIAAWAGEAIITWFEKEKGTRPKVNLTNPEVLFRIYAIQENYWFALDLVGEFAIERNYRKFNHPAGLRSQLGFLAVLLSGWERDKGLLFDPTTGSGTIPIEAALFYLNKPVSGHHWQDFLFHKWELLTDVEMPAIQPLHDSGLLAVGQDLSSKFIKFAEVHSEEAGVGKCVSFQVQNFLKKAEIPSHVSHLVFNPPFGVRMGKRNLVEELYSTIYKSCEENGINSITHFATKRNLAHRLAENHGFRVGNEYKFVYGGITVYLIKFSG